MPPLRIMGSRNAQGSFRLELDERAFARGRKLLDRYRDQPLNVRMSKATLAAARVLEGPMKQATPVSKDKDPGVMKRRTRARNPRYRLGSGRQTSVEALVGPVTRYSHLPIRGHRIVTRSGRDTGRRSRANPYVDMVAQRHFARAVAEMRRYIFDTSYGRLL